MRSVDEAPEPQWMVVANIVRWRRYGDGGQELRPGTKAYRGGARVFVISTHAGMGNMELTTVGQARNTGHWITIDTSTRHLHTFRAKLVYTPAVLHRAAKLGIKGHTQELAREWATCLERLAAMYRQETYAGAPHPGGCLCHECLTGGSGPVRSG
ncbi:hypothetical protein [Streptomyces sp. NBC_01506]|uniref:hypothetical protein n=1 Tax=Streptomyces sp. NBC_01506 TaxID=2903887 RepID=UPI00386822D3